MFVLISLQKTTSDMLKMRYGRKSPMASMLSINNNNSISQLQNSSLLQIFAKPINPKPDSSKRIRKNVVSPLAPECPQIVVQVSCMFIYMNRFAFQQNHWKYISCSYFIFISLLNIFSNSVFDLVFLHASCLPVHSHLLNLPYCAFLHLSLI